MSRHLAPILGALALLLTGAARGAEGVAPDDLRAGGTNAWGERGRLELRGAFVLHDQVVAAASDRTSATGSAISHVSAGGAWMADRLPLGAAANLAVDRFALRPADGAGSDSRAVTGFESTVGLLARLGGPAATAALEGQLGYGFARVPILTPVVAMPMSPVPGSNLATLQAHGPALAARVSVALGRDVDLEASGRALPLLFGARAAGGSVDLRRFSGGAGARIGMLGAGSLRLSALVGYEADVIDGDGAAAVHQVQHRIGLGLRAGLAQASPAAASKPGAAASPPPTTPPPARLVRGVVQTASDEESPPPVLADVAVTVAGGPEVITGADGGFRIEGLARGLAQLRFSREGFEDRSEVVSVPAEGEVVLAIRLRPLAAARSAALIGQVRTENGAPVAAEVRVLELGLAVRADQAGRFRFDVPPGRYTLTIEAASFVSQRKSAPVGAGEQNIFNVELQRQR